jgi:hypothetical protein
MLDADYSDCSFVSQYWPMFRDLGFPQCDVVFYEDGEFSFIEYYNAPLIPSQTRFMHIAKGFRNIEFNESLIKRVLTKIDPRNPEFWADQILKSTKLEEEKAQKQEADEDWAQKTIPLLLKNDALKERVARYGASEISLDKIALAIAKSDPRKAKQLGIRFENKKGEMVC